MVRCELPQEPDSDPQPASDDDLDGLKEVFYRNLMADMRMGESGKPLVITPELENRVERRIQSFLSATDGSSWVRRRRQAVHGGPITGEMEYQSVENTASHADIYAETAEGNWILY